MKRLYKTKNIRNISENNWILFKQILINISSKKKREVLPNIYKMTPHFIMKFLKLLEEVSI